MALSQGKSFISDLRISRKLIAICFAFSLPIFVLLYQYVKTINAFIQFAQYEAYGNLYQRPLERLLKTIPEHELLLRQAAAGAPNLGDDLQAKRSEIDAAFVALAAADAEVGEVLQFTAEGLGKRQREHVRVATVKSEWDLLKSDLGMQNLTTMGERHSHLVADVRTMITHAGDTSNLILDPDLDSYYLMDVTLLALPQSQDRLATVMRDVRDVLGRRSFATEQRIQFAVLAAQLRESDLSRVTADIQTVLSEDSNFYGRSETLHQNLPAAAHKYAAATEELIGLLTTMVNDGIENVTVERFTTVCQAARDESFNLWDVSVKEFDVLLETRIDKYERDRAGALVMTLSALLVSILLAYFMTRDITIPLARFVAVLNAQAGMDFTRKIGIDRRDEIGQMSEDMDRATDAVRCAMLEIAGNSQELTGVSERFSAVSRQIASETDQTSAQAGTVSAAAEQVSKNIQTVATGIEAMSNSIREVARNAHDAARIATGAVGMVERTNTSIYKLRESSVEIGKVLKVITSIAEQTNLLALNATIEAARAGESGKGFAVVANEVKDLAKETAKATGDIAQKIQTIQEDTKEAVDAIARITQIINEVNDIQTTIAGAVEEQSATTNEIGRNAMEGAEGSTQIAEAIKNVATSIGTMTHGAGQTQTMSSDILRMATDLKKLSQRFTC